MHSHRHNKGVVEVDWKYLFSVFDICFLSSMISSIFSNCERNFPCDLIILHAHLSKSILVGFIAILSFAIVKHQDLFDSIEIH